jgi:hypothetical protein
VELPLPSARASVYVTGIEPGTRVLQTLPARRRPCAPKWFVQASVRLPSCGRCAVHVLRRSWARPCGAIAQMKPSNSRAIAVTTFGATLPAAMSWR